jgi:diaminohydroxyphosphoribosylaminopyrimidine deaminase/5-amino-6-(5-phosphoribosylamino)uracil reductase
LQRPYIVLKWAQTLNEQIAASNQERLLISNPVTNRLVHCWRSNEAAILIGTNTALQDNPVLDNRLWFGKSPLRLLLDKQLRLPAHLHLFSDGKPLVVYNFKKNEQVGAVNYKLISPQKNILQQILEDTYNQGIQSILVEGGAQWLQSFIDAELWDEAKVITNKELFIEVEAVNAPLLKNAQATKSIQLLSDEIIEYKNSANQTLNNIKPNAIT